jgi:hypothetical protein
LVNNQISYLRLANNGIQLVIIQYLMLAKHSLWLIGTDEVARSLALTLGCIILKGRPLALQLRALLPERKMEILPQRCCNSNVTVPHLSQNLNTISQAL